MLVTHDLVTHDLGVAGETCSRVVETGPAEALFRALRHPCTAGLIAAVLRMDANAWRRGGSGRGAERGGAVAGLPVPSSLPRRSRGASRWVPLLVLRWGEWADLAGGLSPCRGTGDEGMTQACRR